MKIPAYVVMDGHDGYTIWRDSAAELFTAETAQKFVDARNAEMKPEHRQWIVGRVVTPVTPATDPARFTEEEAALFWAGTCCWQSAYGMPWTEYCRQPSRPGADFGYCAEHDEES